LSTGIVFVYSVPVTGFRIFYGVFWLKRKMLTDYCGNCSFRWRQRSLRRPTVSKPSCRGFRGPWHCTSTDPAPRTTHRPIPRHNNPPAIPWLGDWLGYTAASDWPRDHYPELIARVPGLTFDDIHRVLSYIDTMNLADRIRCPVLMSVGLQDSVCPPHTAFATYNQIRSLKEYRVYPFADHAVGQEHNRIKNAWMVKVLGIKQL
jgi:pimeloyl-ACP methyl ester carboxylesterase